MSFQELTYLSSSYMLLFIRGFLTMQITRETALQLVTEHSRRGDIIIRHGLSVEASMKAYASRFNGDIDSWGIAGLAHDFDWDVCPTPEEHPTFNIMFFTQSQG